MMETNCEAWDGWWDVISFDKYVVLITNLLISFFGPLPYEARGTPANLEREPV